jgi:hypothetical protein
MIAGVAWGVEGDDAVITDETGMPAMRGQRPRWRVRISTLMLRVVIAALGVALVVERRRSADMERQLAAANAQRPRYMTYRAVMQKAAARPKDPASAKLKGTDDAR